MVVCHQRVKPSTNVVQSIEFKRFQSKDCSVTWCGPTQMILMKTGMFHQEVAVTSLDMELSRSLITQMELTWSVVPTNWSWRDINTFSRMRVSWQCGLLQTIVIGVEIWLLFYLSMRNWTESSSCLEKYKWIHYLHNKTSLYTFYKEV